MDGKALRDEGINRVLDNASGLWAVRYMQVVQKWLDSRPVGFVFTGEAFRLVAQAENIGHPPHHNAWGGMANAVLHTWFEEGRIKYHGGLSHALDPRSHARQYPVYKKVSNRPWLTAEQKKQEAKREALFVKLAEKLKSSKI